MTIKRLLITLKSGKLPSKKTIGRVEGVLSREVYEKLVKYCTGDKRVKVKKLIEVIGKVIEGGMGWDLNKDEENHYKITQDDQEIIVEITSLNASKSADSGVCSPGEIIGTGSFATICTVTDNNDIVKKLFHNERDVNDYMPNVIAIFNALPNATVLGYTSFIPGYTPKLEPYSYVLKKCDGALTDAFSFLDDVKDLQSNWDWVAKSVDTAVNYIETVNASGIIHGDAKVENVLYKDESIHVHDFDGSCLLSNPIDRRRHSITVRYVHPLYFAFKEVYYPMASTATSARLNATVSLLWNVYLAKQTESLHSALQTNLITAQKALILYLYGFEDFTSRAIVDAFVNVANNQSYGIGSDELDGRIDMLFPKESLQDNVTKWMPFFDAFSLRCSLFIRATIWRAFYHDKGGGLIETLDAFCIAALENLKRLVDRVGPSTTHKGGKKLRKKKMTGGTTSLKLPIKSTNLELQKFMNADHHCLNTCLMSIKNINNPDATLTGFTRSRSSTNSGFSYSSPLSASSTLTGMSLPESAPNSLPSSAPSTVNGMIK